MAGQDQSGHFAVHQRDGHLIVLMRRPFRLVISLPLLALLRMRSLVGRYFGDYQAPVPSVVTGFVGFHYLRLFRTNALAALAVARQANFVGNAPWRYVAVAARFAGEVVAQARCFRLFPQHNPQRLGAALALT